MIVAVAFLCVYDLVWELYDRLYPLRYTNLTCSELDEHFEQFLRMGFRHAEMVVELPGHGMLFCVVKWYSYREPGIERYVVFPEVVTPDEQIKQFIENVRARGIMCNWG